jgi:quinol monooxygenase YgiN|tara:strand:- start:330 stop:533 length:204 start_codon:yes stop_codon:yes gene_type:complete
LGLGGVVMLSDAPPGRAIMSEVWDNRAALDARFTHPCMDAQVAALSAGNSSTAIFRPSRKLNINLRN